MFNYVGTLIGSVFVIKNGFFVVLLLTVVDRNDDTDCRILKLS